MSEDQADGMAKLTGDGHVRAHGRFVRSPDTAATDAEAARLRSRSMTYAQIGAHLGITKQSAHAAVARALRDTLEEAAEDVRRLELDKLDALERAALVILGTEHATVSQGKVLEEIDPGPQLAALQVLLKISESRRKLLGLDSPVKLRVDGGVRYEVVGVNPEALT